MSRMVPEGCRFKSSRPANQEILAQYFFFYFFFVQQEIYPPKIFEFAYVTDGACDIWDIQQTELLMLKVWAR